MPDEVQGSFPVSPRLQHQRVNRLRFETLETLRTPDVWERLAGLPWRWSNATRGRARKSGRWYARPLPRGPLREPIAPAWGSVLSGFLCNQDNSACGSIQCVLSNVARWLLDCRSGTVGTA